MKKVIFLLLGIIILTSGCVYSNNTTDVDTLTSASVVNNTNIGCYGGEGGTCERVNGTTYTASNNSVDVYVKYHVVNNNAHTVFYVYINKTIVLWRDFTTIQSDQNESFAFNIPKGANFSYYNNSAVHHVEWREYPILPSGNGTITGGSNYNASYVTYTNWTGDVNGTNHNLSISNLNATNVTARRYNLLNNQTDLSLSRTFGTVYQNTQNKSIFIEVSANDPAGVISIIAYSDASSPPTTVVAVQRTAVGGANGYVAFLVMPGNFYKLSTSGGAATVNSWVEVDSI